MTRLLFILLISPLFLLAQSPEAPPLKEPAANCRCCNLSRVHPSYLKNLPPPKFRDKIGNASLEITTTSPEAQRWFNHGLNHLHGFWEFEAYRSFLEALKHDPNCAMAYWGICMSLPGKDNEALPERTAALQIALSLSENISKQEKLYIEMVKQLASSGTNSAIDVLQKITRTYPEDFNAMAWHGFWLRDGYWEDGSPKTGTEQGLSILREALKKKPDHTALNHYLIHLLEAGPDFEKARSSAKSLADTAPNSGHLVHMPGHIYYLAGEYEKACQAFLACRALETTYLKEESIPPYDNKNYLHNLHYLVQASADAGNYELSGKIAKELSAINTPKNRAKAIGSQINYYIGSTASAIPHIRARQFDKAAHALDGQLIPEDSAAKYYLRFLKTNCQLKQLLFNTQKLSPSQKKSLQDLRKLHDLHSKALLASTPQNFAEIQPLKQAQMATRILEAEMQILIDNFLSPNNSTFSETWLSMALHTESESSYNEPPLLPSPVHETVGWFALTKGHPKKAAEYFKAALKKRPQSPQITQGLKQAGSE